MMASPFKILVLSEVRGDTRRFRTFHPYEQLSLAGVPCRLSHLTHPALLELVSQAEMVIFHRTAWDGYVEKLFQITPLAILDVDDLIFEPDAFQWIDSPDFQEPLRAALYRGEMRRQRDTLDACQAVIASTDFLADQVRQMGKPAWVHRNAFSLEMLKLSEQAYQHGQADPSRVIIGYASGTPTHDRDFAVVKPALKHIMQQYPQVELWLVGSLNPGRDWGNLAGRVKRFPWMPWRKLPALLVQFDINLAPLVMDNPFAQSKSEIKYMEAALLRVPTIASPTDAFQYAIRAGENGFLAANLHEWAEALDVLVSQPDVRKAVGDNAYAHTLANYHPSTRSGELIATLNQISEQQLGKALIMPLHAAEGEPVSSNHTPSNIGYLIDPALERSPSLAQMALYSLKYRGLRTLLVQLWIYFRRLLAPIFPYKSDD